MENLCYTFLGFLSVCLSVRAGAMLHAVCCQTTPAEEAEQYGHPATARAIREFVARRAGAPAPAAAGGSDSACHLEAEIQVPEGTLNLES